MEEEEHKKGNKEATQEEDTECDLLCGNKVTVALECCKEKRLCLTCLQKLLYVAQVTTGTSRGNDLKMSDLGIAIKCPFCRQKSLLVDS
tara:strand:+ start:884 stop:1150 length:267 start_codon:yes stop_codon:yes gene_type:complete